jgi:hypothetical protein
MSQSRLTSLGLEGGKDRKDSKSNSINTKDTYIKTFEFQIKLVAATTAQNTGIFAGSRVVQVISAYLDITAAEVTGTTKTINVGIGAAGNNVLNGTSVAATGAVGTPLLPAITTTSSNNQFTYTLASNNFAELVATCVVTCICQDD